MKTEKIAAALLSLLLISCSSDDTLYDTPQYVSWHICFGATDSSEPTRAAIGAAPEAQHYVLRSAASADTMFVHADIGDITTRSATRASMQHSMYDEFKVVAQLKDTDGSIGSGYYMNETATKTGGVWQPSATYYWPGSRQLRFMAWAPTEDGIISQTPTYPTVSAENTTIKYTVPTDASKQHDLMAAATPFIDCPATSGGISPVELQFKHLCTAVMIKTSANMAAGTIKSATITGVRHTGTYDMTASQWTLDPQTTDYTITPNANTTATTPDGTQLYNGDAAFMMLPQTLGTESKLEVVFHDNNSNTDRILSASLNGAVWPMGKTVTYRLSITPYYELEFVDEPATQDAHYVIYPINIRAQYLADGWTLTSNAPDNVTFVEKFENDALKKLVDDGYWLKHHCGTSTLTSKTGGNVKIYVFLKENIGDTDRNITLTLTPKNIAAAEPATFSFRQYCPAWNGDIGVERIQDADYTWGFNWDTNMKITYTMPNDALTASRHLMFSIFGDKKYITQSGVIMFGQTWRVTIDFSKVPKLTTATSTTDGLVNTWELYNFDGINDASSIMSQLEEWGGVPDRTLPENPSEFAAWACAKKNAYEVTKKNATSGGSSGIIYAPVLKREDMVWYLPSKTEAPLMNDNLAGDYWTSTAITNPGTTAYKYTADGAVSSITRNTPLHVRAVRKRQ